MRGTGTARETHREKKRKYTHKNHIVLQLEKIILFFSCMSIELPGNIGQEASRTRKSKSNTPMVIKLSRQENHRSHQVCVCVTSNNSVLRLCVTVLKQRSLILLKKQAVQNISTRIVISLGDQTQSFKIHSSNAKRA